MIEVLILGNVKEDFKRLGIEVRETYKGEDYGVCEITNTEFKVLCDEVDSDGTWNDCGWRYCEGSNQKEPTQKLLINGKEIIGWYDDSSDFDSEEEREEYLKKYGDVSTEFSNLLNYLCDEMGCSQPRNICALTKDLAKYNNLKLSELFKIYQE